MDAGKDPEISFNPRSQLEASVDISFNWKLREMPALDLNDFSVELYRVLNRRTPALREIMNSPPELSATMNDFRTPPSGGVFPLDNILNETDMSRSIAQFGSINHRQD
jgi:hypothetical protein